MNPLYLLDENDIIKLSKIVKDPNDWTLYNIDPVFGENKLIITFKNNEYDIKINYTKIY